jgi:hypothetical protein
MRRREFICFLVLGLVCPCVALAQQSAKQTRIGWPSPFSSSPTPLSRKTCNPFARAFTSATSSTGTLPSSFAMQKATSTDCLASRRSSSSKRWTSSSQWPRLPRCLPAPTR